MALQDLSRSGKQGFLRKGIFLPNFRCLLFRIQTNSYRGRKNLQVLHALVFPRKVVYPKTTIFTSNVYKNQGLMKSSYKVKKIELNPQIIVFTSTCILASRPQDLCERGGEKNTDRQKKGLFGKQCRCGFEPVWPPRPRQCSSLTDEKTVLLRV